MNKHISTTPVAVITGAASGLGLAIAKACIQKNKHVVMADIDADGLASQAEALQTQANTQVISVVCDVTSLESVQQLASKTLKAFNRIDWLFNNAGISGRIAPVWELNPAEISSVIDVNLYGVLNGVHAFLPLMFKQKFRSHIINMASFYGLCSGSNMAAYAMSKHAIVALSESLYFDLQHAQKPVDISVVCPSFANTRLLANSMPEQDCQLHGMMADLIERSRPVDDVVNHIMNEIENNTFYILPDREVKDYIAQRVDSVIKQTAPHQHNLEKLMAALTRRIQPTKV